MMRVVVEFDLAQTTWTDDAGRLADPVVATADLMAQAMRLVCDAANGGLVLRSLNIEHEEG